MVKANIAFIANYLWRESIKNLSNHLTETELKSFSSNDYYYLTTIYYMGKPNFTQLAEVFKLTKPAITVMIKKLYGMGLIDKVQSTEDKRMYYVVITAKGKSIIDGDEKLYQDIDQLIRNIVLTEDKYTLIDELLNEIVKSLEI